LVGHPCPRDPCGRSATARSAHRSPRAAPRPALRPRPALPAPNQLPHPVTAVQHGHQRGRIVTSADSSVAMGRVIPVDLRLARPETNHSRCAPRPSAPPHRAPLKPLAGSPTPTGVTVHQSSRSASLTQCGRSDLAIWFRAYTSERFHPHRRATRRSAPSTTYRRGTTSAVS
jgi:hypothetical protein